MVWILRQAEIWYRETSQTLVLRLDRGCLLAEKIGGQDLLVDSFAGEASTQGFHQGCGTSAPRLARAKHALTSHRLCTRFTCPKWIF